MPLYEYECEACGQRFEQIQSFSDPPVEKCSTCGGPVRKLMSNPAFQFKGSGWYITDYARKGQNADTGDKGTDKGPERKDEKDKKDKKDQTLESGAKSAGSTDRDKSSPASDSPSSSSPATPSTGSSSSDS
jgi:putative FmdB family regulatory protein